MFGVNPAGKSYHEKPKATMNFALRQMGCQNAKLSHRLRESSLRKPVLSAPVYGEYSAAT
jgi:hypothetical protein